MTEKEKLWLKAATEGKPASDWPFLMEEKNGVRLYKTQSWYTGKDHREHGNTPVYHVWSGNEWLATEHYLDAFKVWKDRAKEVEAC